MSLEQKRFFQSGRQFEQNRIIKMLEEHKTELQGNFTENDEHQAFLEGLEEAISILQLNIFLDSANDEVDNVKNTNI
jgi:hypothetical protein